MIRQIVSPMPIGRTPGCLSSAISRQATKADIPFGSTYCGHSFLAMEAIAVHKSAEAVLKELHNRSSLLHQGQMGLQHLPSSEQSYE